MCRDVLSIVEIECSSRDSRVNLFLYIPLFSFVTESFPRWYDHIGRTPGFS